MSAFGGSNIVTNGLVLCLDAANIKSYSGSGTAWNDLSGNGNHFTINPDAFNSASKYMDFNGSYGCAKKINSDLIISGDVTAIVWTRILNSSTNWRTLFRALSTGADHQVIVQEGGWNIGMFDGGSGFNSAGFSQQSLPGYGTSQWNMLVWRWNNSVSPYYSFSYNDSPEVIRGSISSSSGRFTDGICSIGGYHNQEQTNPSNASQYWGDISSVALYNRVLTNQEIKQNFNGLRGRFSL